MSANREDWDLEDEDELEFERYELRAPAQYFFEPDRREFVQVLGAGLIIATVAETVRAQRPGRGAARRDESLDQRFHVGVDGVVTVLTSKVEAGQGARTQITQAAAEELRLPIDRIRLIMADTQQCPDDGGTAGSRTTPSTVPRVRAAAALAREVLIGSAAERLNVAPNAVQFQDGVFRTDSGGQFTLAELAADKELLSRLKSKSVAGEVPVTPVERWQVLGTKVGSVRGRDVVTGAAKFPSDVIRPGMWYGKVLRPTSYGAKLREVDLAPGQAMADVAVVRDGDFVGCAAPTSWQAAKACGAIAGTAKWEPVTLPPPSMLTAHLIRTSEPGRRGVQTWGGFDPMGPSKTRRSISRLYGIAFIQHAPMEPRAAVAEWNDGRLTVWTGTQQPSRVQGELCQAFRLPPDRVRVIVPDTGGGFGGKHTGEAAVEAARLAKGAGRPVHLRWTREEEFTSAYFRPAGAIKVAAGVTEGGQLADWDFINYNSGGSAIEPPYRVEGGRTMFVGSDSPLRQGSYRALASTANTFAREVVIDELAELVSADPLEFRLERLKEQRLKNVLQAAADKFDWRRRRTAKTARRGVGLACGTEKGSFVAACAEVEVIGHRIRVLQVCQAFECGAIQNPGNLRAQVEGCLIMGLGGALFEEILWEEGRITTTNFSSYRVPRLADVPELDIVLVDRPDLPSVGAGETPIIAVAPAIANAVYHAVAFRCQSLPLRILEL